jgi:hypothetical protein
MSAHAVTAVALPLESGIATLYAQTHLADAYSVELPGEASKNPEVLARFVFTQLPGWATTLMKIRDALVAGLGLKTAKRIQASDAKAQASRIGLFKIYSSAPAEIILGEDDKHLDFRLSLLVSDAPSSSGKQRLTVSTVVHCHNRMGRTYIFLIAPFHRWIMQACLRRAARRGWPRHDLS